MRSKINRCQISPDPSRLPFKAKKPKENSPWLLQAVLGLLQPLLSLLVGHRYCPLWSMAALGGDAFHKWCWDLRPGLALSVPQFSHLENGNVRSHFCCLCSSQDWEDSNKHCEGSKEITGRKREREQWKGKDLHPSSRPIPRDRSNIIILEHGGAVED